MGIFTLTQGHVRPVNVYLIPNSNGCVLNCDMFPNTGESHFQDVDDPIMLPDDNATYLYSDDPSETTELLNLPNVSYTGTINYIKVYSRGCVVDYSPGPNTNYKIAITDNNCTNIYYSPTQNLLKNTYSLFNYQWTDNPRTGVTWTWNDINNLQIGFALTSPTLSSSSGSITLRPDSAGDATNFERGGTNDYGANYKQVWEAIADDDGSWVRCPTSAQTYDLYNIETDATLTSANINSVTVYARMKHDDGLIANAAWIDIKTGGTLYTKGKTLTTSWTLYSNTWTTNPNTGVAWTKADIDALQIGATLQRATPGDHAGKLTQIYAVIDYDINICAELRCTQTYVRINYTPDDSTCTLNKPEILSLNQEDNIKMLNMWSGNRYVYALNRKGKTVVMQGKEWGEDACDTMLCVRAMAENGDPVDVTGLTGTWWNSEFRIASFGYRKLTDYPELYEWIIELEYTT